MMQLLLDYLLCRVFLTDGENVIKIVEKKAHSGQTVTTLCNKA